MFFISDSEWYLLIGMTGNLIWEMEFGSWTMVQNNKSVDLGSESKDTISNWNFGKIYVGNMELPKLKLSKNARSKASIIGRLKNKAKQKNS